MTSPDEPQTPLTDEHLSHLNLLDGNKVVIPIETVALLRQLELELIGSRRIIDEMGVELREAQEACIKSAAYNNFVKGGDIPNTIEAARIALVQRCETAEKELRKAQVERDLAIAHDRQPYPTAAAYEAVCVALRKTQEDAARYRWLRSQDWDTSQLFVVKQPTEIRLGTDCPSRDRLDAAIDAAIKP